MFTADIDIGGTFTDGFFTRGDESYRSKVLTTPHDLTECFLNCLKEGAAAFGLPLKPFLREAVVTRLSTTLGTNTLLQRRGPKIGLLVTEGHEQDLYGEGPAPVLGVFLRPDMVLGIRESVDDAGRSIAEPEASAVLAAVRQLVQQGARMIAVSFAASWRHPRHEQLVREIVRARYPEHYMRSIPLQLGHEVGSAVDDHARTNTVVLNAYLHAELARGLFRAEERAREQGLRHPLLVVHASGGCARVAKSVAVQTLSSGPAAAISGAAAVAGQLGLERVVTADMGGTSLDVAVLDGGVPARTPRPRVAGVQLAVPMIETASIGAGGGSIARVVDGRIQVGPQSAGSAPGPACYDKGGMEPTVTDANLVLGFLDPDRFLNGRMKLSRKRAEDALTRRLARPLGAGLEEVAADVRATVDANMGTDLARRLREHGGDPAAFTLFAFGGGGPLHGCAMAEHAGIRRVVGFPFGSVFSAFGSSTSDVRHLYHRNLDIPLDAPDASSRLSQALADLRRQALLDMRGEGFAWSAVACDAQVVLQTPAGERQLPLPEGAADGGIDASAVAAAARPGASLSQADRLVVRALLLDAYAAVPHWLPPASPAASYRPDAAGERSVAWAGGRFISTPLFRLDDCGPGAELAGPAIIEAADTSYAVPPDWTARIDAWANVVMERA